MHFSHNIHSPEDVARYLIKSIPPKYFTEGNPEPNYLLNSNVTVTTVTFSRLSSTISCFDFSQVCCATFIPLPGKGFPAIQQHGWILCNIIAYLKPTWL